MKFDMLLIGDDQPTNSNTINYDDDDDDDDDALLI